MSLIGCTADCIYQTDGLCSLQRVPTAVEKMNPSNNCIHYIKAGKINSKQSLSHHKES